MILKELKLVFELSSDPDLILLTLTCKPHCSSQIVSFIPINYQLFLENIM